jgi:hypothetical protein
MARPKVSTGLSGLWTVAVFAAATTISGCTTHIADSVPPVVGGLPEHTGPSGDGAGVSRSR